jgi:hypothetical protein
MPLNLLWMVAVSTAAPAYIWHMRDKLKIGWMFTAPFLSKPKSAASAD